MNMKILMIELIYFRTTILGIIFLCTGFKINAQGLAWVKNYGTGNENYSYARDIAIDPSGNIYITGSSYLQNINTWYDYTTIKYNSSGIQQWVAIYNGPSNQDDDAYAIAVDNVGNVYVTGASWGTSGNYTDYCTIKYNTSGVQQWVARYNGPANGWDAAGSIAVDNLGNVYVTGSSEGDGNSGSDYTTVKYNSAGTEQWVARFNYNDGNEGASDIAIDDSGNVYVSGVRTPPFSPPYNDFVTIKYNSLGEQQWVTYYYDGDWGGLSAIDVNDIGEVYISGFITLSYGDYYKYITVKYNPNGLQLWESSYSYYYQSDNQAYDMIVDGPGNVYVTGASNNGLNTHYDIATVKYNSSGYQEWVARYNGPVSGYDAASAITIDKSGNVYVSGRSTGFDYYLDFATIKYNSSGTQQWAVRYNKQDYSDDGAAAIALDSTGNVYLTGTCEDLSSVVYTTIKYIQIPSSVDEITSYPISFELCQNYPNPFNPVTKIKYSIPASLNPSKGGTLVQLIVYDILGREVKVLVNEEKQSGAYEIEFNGSNLPSGVYLYRLTAGEFTETKKLVLLK